METIVNSNLYREEVLSTDEYEQKDINVLVDKINGLYDKKEFYNKPTRINSLT